MNSSASLTVASLSIGTHAVTAVYGGDAAFHGSTSATSNQVVVDGISQATLSTSSLPGGTRQIKAVYGGDGLRLGSQSSTLGQVVGDDVHATLSTSILSGGTHQIKAVYGGDGSHAGSTSSILSQQVATGTNVGWTATVMPSGKSINVRSQRPDGSSYQLRPLSFTADGTSKPVPTIKINGGAAISLPDCLWPPKQDAYPDYGNPNFFFPIPQPARDIRFLDDRNGMVFDGSSSYAETSANPPLSQSSTFVVCFRATNPQSSPKLASHGSPANGGWEISLGGTASAMTVTFSGGGKTLTVSQLTHYTAGYALNLLGQWGYFPRYGSKWLNGPVNLVADRWYRASVSIGGSGVAFRVSDAGYALTDYNGSFVNSVLIGQATDSTLNSFPRPASHLFLGRSSPGGSYYAGKICDIEIRSGELNTYGLYRITQGAWVDHEAPGLAALWGGPSGTSVQDASGAGASPLTLSNVSWDADVMVAGIHGVEGTDLSMSHGSLVLSGGSWSAVHWQEGDITSSSCPGFNGRYWKSTDSSASAVFSASSLTAGRQYKVAICYVPDFDRETNVTVVVHDGLGSGPVIGQLTLDQTMPCDGLSWDMASWKPIGTYTPTGGTLTFVLTKPGGAKQLVVDSIRLEGVRAPVAIGPSDVVTITLPDAWSSSLDYPSQAVIEASGGTDVQVVNRSGDIFNQGVKFNPRTMKAGYNLGPVSYGGPAYYYRNRVKDQNYSTGTVSVHNNVLVDFRGQCDVTSSGLWTVKYKTLDGSGNHVTLYRSDSGPNISGSQVVEGPETITGGVATRTYSVTCAPSRNSPIIGLGYSGNIDYSSIAVYPPDPSNPSQSLSATGSDAADVWHPNFLANMSVGFESFRPLGLTGMYNAAVLSDYGMSTDSKMHYFDARERSGALISSISPIDNNPATDADGVVGFGYRNNLCFYAVTTATPHNMYRGDSFGVAGTNMPWSVPASFPGYPGQGNADFGNVRWDGPLSFSTGLVAAVSSPTRFIVVVNTDWYPPTTPADGAPGTIAGTTTPGQYGANDWKVHSWVGYNMPLDHMVDLSNRTGTMLHFNLGPSVTGQGARDLGSYFATHLNPGIGIRVEYTNEPFSFFPQYRYFFMWAAYGAFMESKGLQAPYGSWNKDICYAGLSTEAVTAFKAGWQSAGRDPAQVRHFLNYTIQTPGWISARAREFGANDVDVGYSPYYFNDYFLSGAGSYYPNDPTAIVDGMDVEMWLDHYEVMMGAGGWDYWAGHYGAESLVSERFGHWVDSNGNPFGDQYTKYKPGLKYIPGGSGGNARIVTYEGGPQQIAMTWGSGSNPAGSYMMSTKCRQMFRHPRMKAVNDSCLQVLNDIGNTSFLRFQTGGFTNKGMIRYWSDLDLYNQTHGKGDGSDGKNNNVLYPESNTAISPMYTSMRDWAAGIRP